MTAAPWAVVVPGGRRVSTARITSTIVSGFCSTPKSISINPWSSENELPSRHLATMASHVASSPCSRDRSSSP